MSCYVLSIIIVKAAFTHLIPFTSLYLYEISYSVHFHTYLRLRGLIIMLKVLRHSFFEVSSYKCRSTLHIKAVVGPEYIVIQISSTTLRKLIYKDCVYLCIFLFAKW